MTRLGRITKVVLTAAVAAMVLSALVASSAAAAIVPAKFSSTGMRLPTSGITVKRNGLDPKVCTYVRATEGETYGNNYWVTNEFGLVSRFKCPLGAELQLAIKGEATYDTVAKRYDLTIHYSSGQSQWSPWGQYWQNGEVAKGTWVNGSGSTPSKVTFTDQTVGHDASGKSISITGTFNPTTMSGGLLTLSN